jgi:hypothetical protein
MNLNAGSTLQNQKYIIRTLLHQSDFGRTYEAQHTYLQQPVVLQTLNDSLCQRSDFAQICQQFLDRVRSIPFQPDQARVLDCFEEGGMPFVVFELMPGRVPPQLRDWLPLSPQPVPPPTPSVGSATRVADLPAASVGLPPAVVISNSTNNFIKAASTSTASTNTATNTAVAEIADPPRIAHRSSGWLSMTLIAVSMLGGLLGAGFGLALRLAPNMSNNSSQWSRGWLSREQTFPSESEWPISETPRFFPSSPAPVEQPVYQASPSVETYTPPNLPAPHVAPAQPLPDEQPKTAPSKPQASPAAITPAVLGVPDVTLTKPTEPQPAPTVLTEPAPLVAPVPPASESRSKAPDLPRIKEPPLVQQ